MLAEEDIRQKGTNHHVLIIEVKEKEASSVPNQIIKFLSWNQVLKR
jgi:hypothetical protein